MKSVYKVTHSEWNQTTNETMTSSELEAHYYTNLLKAWKHLVEATSRAGTELPSYSTVARSMKEAKDMTTGKCETATGYVWYSIRKHPVL